MKFIDCLEWDSQFFGFPVAKVIGHEDVTIVYLSNALKEAEDNKISCLYVEVPMENDGIIDFCGEAGFKLVDIKTTLSKTANKNLLSLEVGMCLTSERKPEYFAGIVAIAEAISCKSRFAFDKGFGAIPAKKLYTEWVRKSFYENYCDELFISLISGKPVGFISLKIKENRLNIELLGVSSEYAGRGVGTTLIEMADNWCLSKKMEKLCVVTQGNNLAALRLYQKCGFRTSKVKLFFHKWLVKR